MNRVEQGISKPLQPGVRNPCPCCGYLTLEERGGYEICELCNWEDDGQADPFADEVWGGPNHNYALSKARNNFQKFLIMYDPTKPNSRIGGAASDLERTAKRAIMAAFGAMAHETDQTVIDRLWQQVKDNEQILRSETRRKIEEYQARRSRDNSANQT